MTTVVTSNAASMQWANYVDLQNDVLDWLQLPAMDDANTAQMKNLQLIIDMTCSWAQRKLGQPIAPTTFDRRFDGWANWNGAYIMLPYTPVLEIVSCVEYWGISGPHDLSESTPTTQIDGFQCKYNTGRLTRVFPGNVQKPWFPGSRNIEVVWTAGWNPVPPDWKVATLEMIKHWWRNTFQKSAMGPSASAGGTFSADEIANGMWEGTPLRIAELLGSAVQVGIG